MDVTLTSKCQLTLPAKVREHLHVHEGDRLSFFIKENGEVVVRPKKGDWRKLIGMLHRSGEKAMTKKQTEEAADAARIEEWNEKQKRQARK